MLGREYDQICSIARTLEVLGERWTLLIIRDVFNRRRRFEQIQENLGIARNVLAARLALAGRTRGSSRSAATRSDPPRYEYFLTEKGLDLWPVMVSLLHWGDRHLAAGDGPPIVIRHKACGGRVDDRRICERCGEHLDVRRRDRRARAGRAGGVARPGRRVELAGRWTSSSADEQRLLRDTVRDFARQEVAPVAEELDRTKAFPYEIVAKLGELGLMGIPFPEEYGGGGADTLSYALAVEELARVDSSVAITMAAHTSLGTMPIYLWGTDEQKAEWLPELCAGRKLAAFGLTEPEAGSDAGQHAHPRRGSTTASG